MPTIYMLASSMTQGGIDLKSVIIVVFVLAVLCGIGYLVGKIPDDMWWIKWIAWFLLAAVAIVIAYRFLQGL